MLNLKERIGHGDRSLRSFENNYFITKFRAPKRDVAELSFAEENSGALSRTKFSTAPARKHEANGKIQFAANLIRSPRSDLYYERRETLFIDKIKYCLVLLFVYIALPFISRLFVKGTRALLIRGSTFYYPGLSRSNL